ncbi:hypothetical protein PG994_001716 [Apiospora phragmitis]|uniref:Esterase n=1 Tax=Apiospora phragmitis TaxID=2905665 RepID=A0ABR1WUF4_9PEZI
MMAPYSALTALALGASLAAGSVTIRKTGTAPTGYEVDFKYTNASANRILIGGGLQPFTDQFHTTMGSSALYDPKDYKAGDFYIAARTPEDYVWPYEMVPAADESGAWTFTTPLPSGVYSFAYLVDCDYAPRCSIDTGKLFVDPELPPFRNTEEDQVASTFQVPFDPEFQLTTAATPVDFDYALSAPRGRARHGPDGQLHEPRLDPPGARRARLQHLPAGRVRHRGRQEVPAAVHEPRRGRQRGRLGEPGPRERDPGQPDSRRPHRADSRSDALVLQPRRQPAQVRLRRRDEPRAAAVGAARARELRRVPLPWVEAHYDVCDEPACRAFSGLSLGGRLSYEMYVNATDLFAYYGFFSPAASPPFVDAAAVEANPGLAEKGLFVGYGLYDSVFDLARGLQGAFDDLGFQYISRVAPYGSHYWPTWQDNLWWFGVTALWKPIPFTQETGR